MSAKTLRLLIGMTGCSGSPTCIHCAATAELAAIEKAARFVTDVDTDAAVTHELAAQAVEASETLERIAKESTT